MRKHFYFCVPSNTYFLCLGFMKWAAQGLRLEKVTVGEEDCLWLCDSWMLPEFVFASVA